MTRIRSGGAARAASPARRVLALLLTACAAPAAAQDSTGWSGTGQLGLQHSTGTSSYTSLTLDHDLVHTARARIELHTAYGWSRSSYPLQTFDANGNETTITSRSDHVRALADLQVQLPADGRLFATVRSLIERDDNQNIGRRVHAALGAGARLLQREHQTLQAGLSGGYIHERDATAARQDYPAAAASLDHTLSFGSRGGQVSTSAEYVHALQSDAGGLARGQLSLYAPFTSAVGLNVSWSLVLDTQPARGAFDPDSDDEVVTQDARTTSSLSVGVRAAW